MGRGGARAGGGGARAGGGPAVSSTDSSALKFLREPVPSRRRTCELAKPFQPCNLVYSFPPCCCKRISDRGKLREQSLVSGDMVQGIQSIVVAMVAWSMFLRACTSNTELREEALTLAQMLAKL